MKLAVVGIKDDQNRYIFYDCWPPSSTLYGAQTKRPKAKLPRDIRSQGHKVPGTKRPTLLTKFSKTHFLLENWPQMLGNGTHPCIQFMIGLFLFWGG